MGNSTSVIAGHLKRLFYRYNAENRALSFIEKGKIKPAPRHSTQIDKQELLKKNPLLKEKLEDLKKKDPNLNEYLKKVYLTSPDDGKSLPVPVSKRPLPVRRDIGSGLMIFEPKEVSEGHLTLSRIVKLILMHQEDPQKYTSAALAKEFQIERETVVKLLTNYSLFRQENLNFMNLKSKEESDIQFEVYTQLEKKPLKQIEGKR